MCCDIHKSEMAMTTEKSEIENEKKRSERARTHTHTKPNAESNECFAILNRPPPIFHESKTQTVKIETFDL